MVSLTGIVLTLVDGGTLAFPTPDEADHGKVPWPHVSPQSCLLPPGYTDLDLGGSERLPALASLHSRSAESRMSSQILFHAFPFWNPADILHQLPNGPQDGGLVVMTGSAALFEQFFKENPAVSSKSPLIDSEQSNTNRYSPRAAG